MLKALFPTVFYLTENKQHLKLANSFFDRSRDKFVNVKTGGDFYTTLQKYNIGGARVDPDMKEWPEYKPLNDYFISCVEDFLQQYEAGPYTIEIPNVWLNEMSSGNHHQVHRHYGYALSGVYYVKCPPNSEVFTLHNPNQEANIFRYNSLIKKNQFNTYSVDLHTPEGTLVIFPSHIRHSVPVLEFEGVRRTMAFDVYLKE